MAATFIARIGGIASRFRKPILTTALGLAPDGSGRVSNPATIPCVSAGAGAPTAAAPDGSQYNRTDATDGTDAVYMRIAGAWVALAG